MIGDMAIKDLTPASENIGGRLVKNFRICGSGIYKYNIKEAPLLGLDPVPEKYRSLEWINVYRPPEVLEKYKDFFARVPIITGHHIRIDRDNAKRYSVGMIGDTVRTEIDKEDGELYLYTTGTIIAGDGVRAYEDLGQLSVGYDPVIEWEEGEHNGEPYQAVLKKFDDVNHVLICKTARGGPQCMVMDSLDESPLEKLIKNGGNRMNFFSKIFGRKLVGDEAVAVTLIQSIAVGADPSVQVPKIKKIVGDSNKEFTEYLDELVEGKDADSELRTKACKAVEDFYVEKMCGDKCGDEDKKPAGDEDKKPEDKKPEDKKPEDEKPAGDEGKPCEKCGKSPCECGDEEKKPEDKKPAGDEDKKPEEEPKKQAGDELVEEVTKKVLAKLEEKEAVKKTQDLDLGMPMPGDAKPETDDKLGSSDDILALMRG